MILDGFLFALGIAGACVAIPLAIGIVVRIAIGIATLLDS